MSGLFPQRERALPLALDATFAPPRVSITLGALQKIMAYARACPVEVSGLGTVVREGNDLCITDACTLPQAATAVSAETDDWAVHEYLFACIRRGEDPSAVRLQWHSHGDLDVFCSGLDLATIAVHPGDFTVSLVVNRRGEYHCRLDLYRPFRIGFTARLHVRLPEVAADVREAAAAEVARNVRLPSATSALDRLTRALGFGDEPQPPLFPAVAPRSIAVPVDETTVVGASGARGGGAADDSDR